MLEQAKSQVFNDISAEEKFRKSRLISLPVDITHNKRKRSKLEKLKKVIKNYHNTEAKGELLKEMSRGSLNLYRGVIKKFLLGKTEGISAGELELLKQYKDYLGSNITQEIKENFYGIMEEDSLLVFNKNRNYINGYFEALKDIKKIKLVELTIKVL